MRSRRWLVGAAVVVALVALVVLFAGRIEQWLLRLHGTH